MFSPMLCEKLRTYFERCSSYSEHSAKAKVDLLGGSITSALDRGPRGPAPPEDFEI